jgi:3-hydroxyisobutyrate dehydrogenase
MVKLAFLGLGVMGYPMAGHLQKAGYEVTVYNRTNTKAEKWVQEFGGAHAASPAGAVRDAEIVFACVGADKDVEDVCLGPNGAFGAMAKGSLFIDHTTASPSLARRLFDESAKLGVGFMDAPVSGGQAGAENGQLTIMVGGEASDFARAEPVMNVYAKQIGLIGEAGAGQLTKAVNQICIAGVVQGLSEALHFAMSAGLDGEKVLDVISKGAAQSWQMDNRAKTMLKGEFDFGFAVDWMRKDLAIVLEEARAMGISLPQTALVDQFYADVQAMGGSRQDTSSLIRRFRG